MNIIILIGMKACGKTTVGKLLARQIGMRFVELDNEVTRLHTLASGEDITFRELFTRHGERYFRGLESEALTALSRENNLVISCGGGTPMSETNHKLFKLMGTVIYLEAGVDLLLPRILQNGIPGFFPKKTDPKTALTNIMLHRKPIYEKIADIKIVTGTKSPPDIVKNILRKLNI